MNDRVRRAAAVSSRIDRVAILRWTLPSLALFGFALVFLRATSPGGMTYDEAILRAVNGAFAHFPLATLSRKLYQSDLAELVLVLGIVCAWNATHVGAHRRAVVRRRVLLTVAIFAPAYVISRVMQHASTHARPGTVVALVPLADEKTWGELVHQFAGFGSFPSDHAALAAIAAVMAFSLDRRWGWAFAIFGCYTAVYRIAFGYHWPSDIVGGFALGTALATLALLVRPALRRTLNRAIVIFRRYPVPSYGLAILFLGDFGNGFARAQDLVFEILHGRLFH